MYLGVRRASCSVSALLGTRIPGSAGADTIVDLKERAWYCVRGSFFLNAPTHMTIAAQCGRYILVYL